MQDRSPVMRARLSPARRELDDGVTSLREFYGLPANGFGPIVDPIPAAVDDDEAPAQRRATRPTKLAARPTFWLEECEKSANLTAFPIP